MPARPRPLRVTRPKISNWPMATRFALVAMGYRHRQQRVDGVARHVGEDAVGPKALVRHNAGGVGGHAVAGVNIFVIVTVTCAAAPVTDDPPGEVDRLEFEGADVTPPPLRAWDAALVGGGIMDRSYLPCPARACWQAKVSVGVKSLLF